MNRKMCKTDHTIFWFWPVIAFSFKPSTVILPSAELAMSFTKSTFWPWPIQTKYIVLPKDFPWNWWEIIHLGTRSQVAIADGIRGIIGKNIISRTAKARQLICIFLPWCTVEKCIIILLHVFKLERRCRQTEVSELSWKAIMWVTSDEQLWCIVNVVDV